MADRAFLSIGDVLTLLKDEFPDVTISKIRFLESQGLLDPERTPSGYRKFFEVDVDRLRWILRQQREHFLPLKVIKDRLASGELTNGPDPVDSPPADVDDHGLVAARGPGRPARAVAGDGPSEESETWSAPEAGRAATGDSDHPGSRPPPVEAQAAEAQGVEDQGAMAQGAADQGVEDQGAVAQGAADQGAADQGAAAQAVEAEAPSGAGPSKGVDTGLAASGLATSGQATGGPLMARPPIMSLTVEELAKASGLSANQVAELERYGLISGRSVAGTVYYDEESFMSASLAAGFARYGIEARHLRMYKTAADREAGFLEQVVTPLLKQRNPEARRRAAADLGELALLGERLRASVLRAALRAHLAG